MAKIFLITLLQGILEAFPISSSMHINLFASTNQEIVNTMHLGSALAFLLITWTFICFRIKKIHQVFNLKIILKLIIMPLGTLIIGFIIFKMERQIDVSIGVPIGRQIGRQLDIPNFLSSHPLFFNIISAFAMLLADFSPKKNSIVSLNYYQCLIISLIIPLSLISGVSRMGITYTILRLFHVRRFDSLILTLLIGIPITASVGLIEVIKNFNLTNIICSLAAGVITFFCLRITFYMLRYWWVFCLYRLLFCIILLFFK